MRTAIVHYWLVTMRGGEKVLESLCDLYPDADIFCHAYAPEAISEKIRSHRIETTFIGRLPRAHRNYKSYLPLMPLALEQLDLRGYDLILSSESGPAKGVLAPPEAVHLCYCHSPMRYVWNMYHNYREGAGWMTAGMMVPMMHYLRMWDVTSAQRVDHFAANSANTAARIGRYFGRGSTVIHPPVETSAFIPAIRRGDFYLYVGELLPYKRPDLMVEVFRRNGLPLVVIGGGEMLEALKDRATPNIRMLGPQPFETLRDHYSECKALIFPGEEDFGIVPVEAMASGAPVLALGRGGALETVRDGETGLFFERATEEGLQGAIDRLEDGEVAFDPGRIARHAAAFDRSVFTARFSAFADERCGHTAVTAAVGARRESRLAHMAH